MATTLKKMLQGYGYKYTDLSTIHDELERQKIVYRQYLEYDERAGADYVFTVLGYEEDSKVEWQPALRGCRVVLPEVQSKTNAAQAQGSAITYARRYSLLMALGWATEDDDAVTDKQKEEYARKNGNSNNPSGAPRQAGNGRASEKQINYLKSLLEKLGRPAETISHTISISQKTSAAKVSEWIEAAKSELDLVQEASQ